MLTYFYQKSLKRYLWFLLRRRFVLINFFSKEKSIPGQFFCWVHSQFLTKRKNKSKLFVVILAQCNQMLKYKKAQICLRVDQNASSVYLKS